MTTSDPFTVHFKSTVNFGTDNQSSNSSFKYSQVEIDKARFESVMRKRGIPYTVIETLFTKIDTNGDGKISAYDFQQVLQKYSQKVRTSENAEPSNTRSTIINRTDESFSQITIVPVTANTSSRSPEELKRTLQKQTATYYKNGAPRFSSIGTTINTYA
jgi:Ca2+-binding EF-hand superfamily protein